MNIKTAVNEDGQDLYLIFAMDDDDPITIELNIDTARQLIWLIADLVIAAEATQSLHKKEKITNCN